MAVRIPSPLARTACRRAASTSDIIYGGESQSQPCNQSIAKESHEILCGIQTPQLIFKPQANRRMDDFELVSNHFERMQLDRQETPIKKTKEAEFTSAETTNQTPEKPVHDDIDPQYLFEHFDELVKVEFGGELDPSPRDVRVQLNYGEDEPLNGLLSPPATKGSFEHLLSPSSMRKKKSSHKKVLELESIELFPVEEP